MATKTLVLYIDYDKTFSPQSVIIIDKSTHSHPDGYHTQPHYYPFAINFESPLVQHILQQILIHRPQRIVICSFSNRQYPHKDDLVRSRQGSFSAFIVFNAFAKALANFLAREPMLKSIEVFVDHYLLADSACRMLPVESGSPRRTASWRAIKRPGDTWTETVQHLESRECITDQAEQGQLPVRGGRVTAEHLNHYTLVDPCKLVLFDRLAHRHAADFLDTPNDTMHALVYDDLLYLLETTLVNFAPVQHLLPHRFSADLFHHDYKSTPDVSSITRIGTLTGTGSINFSWLPDHAALITDGERFLHKLAELEETYTENPTPVCLKEIQTESKALFGLFLRRPQEVTGKPTPKTLRGYELQKVDGDIHRQPPVFWGAAGTVRANFYTTLSLANYRLTITRALSALPRITKQAATNLPEIFFMPAILPHLINPLDPKTQECFTRAQGKIVASIKTLKAVTQGIRERISRDVAAPELIRKFMVDFDKCYAELCDDGIEFEVVTTSNKKLSLNVLTLDRLFFHTLNYLVLTWEIDNTVSQRTEVLKIFRTWVDEVSTSLACARVPKEVPEFDSFQLVCVRGFYNFITQCESTNKEESVVSEATMRSSIASWFSRGTSAFHRHIGLADPIPTLENYLEKRGLSHHIQDIYDFLTLQIACGFFAIPASSGLIINSPHLNTSFKQLLDLALSAPFQQKTVFPNLQYENLFLVLTTNGQWTSGEALEGIVLYSPFSQTKHNDSPISVSLGGFNLCITVCGQWIDTLLKRRESPLPLPLLQEITAIAYGDCSATGTSPRIEGLFTTAATKKPSIFSKNSVGEIASIFKDCLFLDSIIPINPSCSGAQVAEHLAKCVLGIETREISDSEEERARRSGQQIDRRVQYAIRGNYTTWARRYPQQFPRRFGMIISANGHSTAIFVQHTQYSLEVMYFNPQNEWLSVYNEANFPKTKATEGALFCSLKMDYSNTESPTLKKMLHNFMLHHVIARFFGTATPHNDAPISVKEDRISTTFVYCKEASASQWQFYDVAGRLLAGLPAAPAHSPAPAGAAADDDDLVVL